MIPLILRRFNHKHFVEILKFLVFKGLDVNAKSVEGKHIFLILCKELSGEFKDQFKDQELITIVELLIECGTDIKAKDDEGNDGISILKRQGIRQSSQVIQLLLQK